MEQLIARYDGLLDRKQYKEAGALLYAGLESALAAGDTAAATGLYNELMGFERQYGSDEKALAAAQAALGLLEREDMAVSRPAAMIALNAATVYSKAGRTEEARALYDRAETLFQRFYPAGAREFAGLYNNRASAYRDPADRPKAEYYYTRALALLRRYADVCDAAVTCLNLAGLYACWPGREKEAEPYLRQAALLMDIPEAERNAYYRYTCRKCASACGELGAAALQTFFTERAEQR